MNEQQTTEQTTDDELSYQLTPKGRILVRLSDLLPDKSYEDLLEITEAIVALGFLHVVREFAGELNAEATLEDEDVEHVETSGSYLEKLGLRLATEAYSVEMTLKLIDALEQVALSDEENTPAGE